MSDETILREEVPLAFLRQWAETGYSLKADFLPIFADALEERGYSGVHILRQLRSPVDGHRNWYHVRSFDDAIKGVLPELSDDNWQCVFAYAGEPDAGDGEATIQKAADHLPDVSVEPFSRWDVKRVIALQDGENDGPDWVCIGELKDGRYFAIRAGCDYTGWG